MIRKKHIIFIPSFLYVSFFLYAWMLIISVGFFACNNLYAKVLVRPRLIGGLVLGFRHNEYSNPHSNSSKEQFRQRYHLSFKGAIWDYRFMPFSSKFKYSKKRSSSQGSNYISKDYTYSLHTTLFPDFRFPFSVGFVQNRSISDADAGNKKIGTGYDLAWYLRFKVLPVTKLTLKYSEDTGWGRDNNKKDYGVRMSKAIGNSQYRLNYGRGISKDNISASESVSNNFGFGISTKVSESIALSNSGFYFDSDSKENGKESINVRKTEGYTSALSYRPSNDFRNSNVFGFTRSTSSGGETKNYSISTRNNYKVNSRLEFNTTLRMSRYSANSQESETIFRNYIASADSSFRITKRTVSSLGVFYNWNKNIDFDPEDATREETLRKNKGIQGSLAQSRARNLKWVSLGTNYGISATYHDTDPGDVTNTFGYHITLRAASRGLKDLALSARTGFTKRYDISENEVSTSKGFGFHVTDTHLKHTIIKAGYVRAMSTKSAGNQESDLATYSMSAKHERALWRGKLQLKARYNKKINYAESSDDSNTSSNSERARYGKRLTRRLSMILSLARSGGDSGDVRYDLSSLFHYYIGAWRLRLQYNYGYNDYSNRNAGNTSTQRIYLTLSRRFGISWI